ncbi:MAG TPA: aldo/keto reductase [Bryobacteraceae bacterium]|nr:aldo/keto reductase [Bryobacteraceae bacterium]
MLTSHDFIDPHSVPRRRLHTGAFMPGIGLGTFGSDRFSAAEIAASVEGAIEVGYRHIDCASVYGNEDSVGGVLAAAIRGGVPREELWITSKLWNDKHAEADVIPQCRKSLADLQLDYLDLYLVHWPFPNFHPPGCSVESRSPGARPYIHANFMKTWRQMEKLVDLGLVRHIGTSNMTAPKLRLVLRDARIKPAVNEMELHPHFQQTGFFEFLRSSGIQAVGFCPIGSPTRPDRDRTPEDTADIEDPVIAEIAGRLGVHPAVVCVKWAVQRGQTPIPQSIRRNEYVSNLRAAVSPPLSDADMRAIAGIDRNCRLIKGQVFLWKENQSWEDLWDLKGEIAQ